MPPPRRGHGQGTACPDGGAQTDRNGNEPRLDDVLDKLAETFDGDWIEDGPPAGLPAPGLADVWEARAQKPVQRHGCYVNGLSEPDPDPNWRADVAERLRATGPHRAEARVEPGDLGTLELRGKGHAARLHLTDAELVLDAQSDRYVAAKAAAELLDVTPAKLTAMWKAGEFVPEVGVLPAKYRAIKDPVAPRPATFYLRSSLERHREGTR